MATYSIWTTPSSTLGERTRPLNGPLREFTELLFEFAGTAMFAFFGGLPMSDPALGNGLALAVLVYCTVTVSGGKLNPAVSLMVALIDGLMDVGRQEQNGMTMLLILVKMLSEWTAQILGGIVGALAAAALVGSGTGCFGPGQGVHGTSVFAAETAITTLLCFTITCVAVDVAGVRNYGPLGPLIIGLALYAGASGVGAISGASANPARFIGPAVAANCPRPWAYFWSYVGGESLGAVIAFLLHAAREAASFYANRKVPSNMPMSSVDIGKAR